MAARRRTGIALSTMELELLRRFARSSYKVGTRVVYAAKGIRGPTARYIEACDSLCRLGLLQRNQRNWVITQAGANEVGRRQLERNSGGKPRAPLKRYDIGSKVRAVLNFKLRITVTTMHRLHAVSRDQGLTPRRYVEDLVHAALKQLEAK